MLTQFEQELEKLKDRIIKMGNIAVEQVSTAVRILFTSDTENIESVEQNEDILDELDVKVDKLCQRIFVLNQPVATDLRFILSSLRIGNEIERIGDIAYGIVCKSEPVREQPDVLKDLEIEILFSETIEVIIKAIECYKNKDISITHEIISKCKIINDKCKLKLDMIIVQMTNKSEIIIVATNLILILRHIERLADHSSNIAESVYFMIKGEIIKHIHKKDQVYFPDQNSNNSSNQIIT
jgi:phosphate transport system protein